MTDSQESDNLLVERKDTNEDEADNDLSDALAALSLTTELDSALISHLNLLDDYMFHVECLFQQFRMVSLASFVISNLRLSSIWLSPSEIKPPKEESKSAN